MYTTVKKEVAKGIFRRPDSMYIVSDDVLDKMEKEAKIQMERKGTVRI